MPIRLRRCGFSALNEPTGLEDYTVSDGCAGLYEFTMRSCLGETPVVLWTNASDSGKRVS